MSNEPDAAPKWRRTTNVGMISAGLGAIVLMFAGIQQLEPMSLTTAIGLVFAGGLGIWERIQRQKCKAAQNGGKVCRPPNVGPGLAVVLFATMLAAATPTSACGTAFADGAAKAGACIGRCALSCATSWVGDLVDLPTPDEQYGHTEGTLPRPGAVLQLLVRDDAGDPVAIMGRLVASPQLVDGGLRVGLMRTADGTLLSVLLAPEPRIWHASAELFDAPIAPDGWVPSGMPESLQDMADRLGEPPATW